MLSWNFENNSGKNRVKSGNLPLKCKESCKTSSMTTNNEDKKSNVTFCLGNYRVAVKIAVEVFFSKILILLELSHSSYCLKRWLLVIYSYIVTLGNDVLQVRLN